MAGFIEPIDPKIWEKVTDLVEKGITQLSVIKKCLKEYIKIVYFTMTVNLKLIGKGRSLNFLFHPN